MPPSSAQYTPPISAATEDLITLPPLTTSPRISRAPTRRARARQRRPAAAVPRRDAPSGPTPGGFADPWPGGQGSPRPSSYRRHTGGTRTSPAVSARRSGADGSPPSSPAERTLLPPAHWVLVKQRYAARVVPIAIRAAMPEFPPSWPYGHLARSERKVTKQARLLQGSVGAVSAEEVRLEVPGDHDARPGRHRLDLLYEHVSLAQASILGRAVGQGLLVPVGREHQARPVEGTHEPPRVVVDLEPLPRRRDQRDVRFEPPDLPLEVIHGAEPEDLASREAQHVGEGAALDVVVHPARPTEVARHDPAVVVVLAVQGRVQARNDLDRQGTELVVLAPVHGQDLGLRHAAGAGEDGCALGADDGRAGLPGDVRHVERVVEVGMRVEDEIRARDPGVDGSRG